MSQTFFSSLKINLLNKKFKSNLIYCILSLVLIIGLNVFLICGKIFDIASDYLVFIGFLIGMCVPLMLYFGYEVINYKQE